MRTGRSLTICRSLLIGGGWIWSPSISPLGVGLDLIPPSIPPLGVGLDLIPLNFPLRCGPGSDPPQLPPWVWAWREGSPWQGGLIARGVSLAGGSPWQGGSHWQGGLIGRGVSLAGESPWQGVSLAGGSLWQGVSFTRGCFLLRGCLLLGGCLPLGRVAVSQHALRQTPPCGQNHRHE